MADKENSPILMDVFENGRSNRESLFKKYESQKSKVQELIKNGIIKSAEVKDMLIIDAFALLKNRI